MSGRFQNPFAADVSSLALLIESLRASLSSAHKKEHKSALPENVNWSDVEHIARMNKLFVAADRGFKHLSITPSDEFVRATADYRRQAMVMNGVYLTTLKRVAQVLKADQIDFAAFKGPLFQHDLYHDYFDRPSSDIDILVHKKDFQHASACLHKMGYILPKECQSPWWYHYLGEQHFFSETPGVAVVDLHHKVQQPGSPGPRDIHRYIASTRRKDIGTTSIPVLTQINATLLSTISLTKAMVRKEPAGGYLYDFAASCLAMTGAERSALRRQAKHQGLYNTLLFSIHCANEVLHLSKMDNYFDFTDAIGAKYKSLQRMILTPRDKSIDWPRVRNILWNLTDSSGFGGKLGNYISDAYRQFASERCRRRHHSSGA